MKINREAILWYAIQYDGDWKKIGNAIKAHENYSIIHYPYAYITIMDEMHLKDFAIHHGLFFIKEILIY